MCELRRFFGSLWQQDVSSSSETCLCVGILKQGKNSLFQTAVGLTEVLLLGSKNSNVYNSSRVFWYYIPEISIILLQEFQ
jgi:hypothetical protein